MYQPDFSQRELKAESRMQRLQEEAQHQRLVADVPQSKRRTVPWVLGLVVLLIILGIVGYLLLNH
jgi:hypothetical protein